MVALRGLARHYPGSGAPALVGLDLTVAAGEILVLVGPSGCGKSTALRLVAGLDRPDAGTVHISGREMTSVPPQDRDVAMVFQGYALYPHMTVEGNMAFPLRMRGVPSRRRTHAVEEAAALLGITPLLRRYPAELSGGERQRVAMGRAIVRAPKVFLFDEPLSNLDAALRSELRTEISALLRRLGATALYVTHDQVEAMTMGDRIAVLRGGALQQVGRPRDIYEDPSNAFVAGFLGSPAMNWVEVEVAGDRLLGAGATFAAPEDVCLPSRALAGIRPEQLDLGEAASSAPGRLVLDAVVTSAEPLGAETHLFLEAGGVKLRAKVGGFDAPERGTSVRLSAPMASVLWFDASTGSRLRSRGPS